MKKWFIKLLQLFKKDKTKKQTYNNHIYEPIVKTYVVALNYQHFSYWCHINGLSIHDKSLRDVVSADKLCGVDGRFTKFVFYGPWRESKDDDDILLQIGIIEAKVDK